MNKDLAKQDRIPAFAAGFMIAFASIVDLTQGFLDFIPYIGWVLSPIIGIVAGLIFYIWYKMCGISFGDSVKRFVLLLGEWLIELIPILNALPAWTLGTIIMVSLVKSEDILANKGVDLNITETKKFQEKMAVQRQFAAQSKEIQEKKMAEASANDTIDNEVSQTEDTQKHQRIPLQNLSFNTSVNKNVPPAPNDNVYQKTA